MHMDSAQGDVSKESKETHAEATAKEDHEHDLPILGNKPKNEKETSCSSSTSSDYSSDEDFFQLDASELNRAVAGSSEMLSTQHGDNAQLASEFRIQNGEATGISESNKHGAVNLSENVVMLAGSQVPTGRPFSPDVSGASPGSDLGILGERQSPPVQVMGRTDVPDPYRIPSSIFERSKSSTPMEWSVTSNESLFSIHVGNSSFSRDHAILLGRSGELGNMPPPISPLAGSSPENMDVGQGLAQPGAAAAANAEAMKDVLRAAATTNAEAMKDVFRAAAAGHADKGEPPSVGVVLSSSISRRSDGSASSFRSFAFPILTEGRSGSVRVEPEPHQPPSETPKAAPSTAENKCFPCFSCCSFCR